eukprot:maker-scaffold_10-snap-gene-6.42-mRNA-1 protein AED:0.41 eAED:0.63 QI:0/0/0/1/0/0/2/0/183
MHNPDYDKILEVQLPDVRSRLKNLWKELEIMKQIQGNHGKIWDDHCVILMERCVFSISKFSDIQFILDEEKNVTKSLVSREIAFYIASGILLGVEHLHLKNFIHRDIEPDNILLSKDLVPKIADFGDTILRTGKTVDHKVKGTEGFVAPEFFLSPYVEDFKRDIFSFGVTILYLIEGVYPSDW